MVSYASITLTTRSLSPFNLDAHIFRLSEVIETYAFVYQLVFCITKLAEIY